MDWKGYQEKVAEFFRQMGASAETNVTVNGARGVHDIDVLITFNLWGQKIIWIGECKLWESAVPKEKVVALYQITQDIGADRGFLFSESGFQSGAIKVTSNTNITLTNLDDIQEIAKEDFYNMYMIKVIKQVNSMKETVTNLWIDDLHQPRTYKNIALDDIVFLDGTLLLFSLTLQKSLNKNFPIVLNTCKRGTIKCNSEDELINNINIELTEIEKEIDKFTKISVDEKARILKLKEEFIDAISNLLKAGQEAMFPDDIAKFEELRLVAFQKMRKVGQISEELKEISRGAINLELHETMRLLIDTIYLYLTNETINIEEWNNAKVKILSKIEKIKHLVNA